MLLEISNLQLKCRTMKKYLGRELTRNNNLWKKCFKMSYESFSIRMFWSSGLKVSSIGLSWKLVANAESQVPSHNS